jgi:hypothetical protein
VKIDNIFSGYCGREGRGYFSEIQKATVVASDVGEADHPVLEDYEPDEENCPVCDQNVQLQ